MLTKKQMGEYEGFPLIVFKGNLYFMYADENHIRVSICQRDSNGEYNYKNGRCLFYMSIPNLKKNVDELVHLDYRPALKVFRVGLSRQHDIDLESYKSYLCDKLFSYFDNNHNSKLTRMRRVSKIPVKEWKCFADIIRKGYSVFVLDFIVQKMADENAKYAELFNGNVRN